ncbi:MAG: hypothetical protein ABGX16_19650 [Pirellulales bacterium]
MATNFLLSTEPDGVQTVLEVREALLGPETTEHDHERHDHDGHAHEGDDHDGHSHEGDDHDGHEYEGDDHDGHAHEGDDHDGHAHEGDDHDGHAHEGDDHDGHAHEGDDHDGHEHEGDDHDGHEHEGDDHDEHAHDGHEHEGDDHDGHEHGDEDHDGHEHGDDDHDGHEHGDDDHDGGHSDHHDSEHHHEHDSTTSPPSQSTESVGPAGPIEVVVVGKIGGLANPWQQTEPDFPFVKDAAKFFLADPAAVAEQQADGHQHAPGEECVFCAAHAQDTSTLLAIVQFKDKQGQILRHDVRKWLALNSNETVVVHGQARIIAGGLLVIDADGLYVRR